MDHDDFMFDKGPEPAPSHVTTTNPWSLRDMFSGKHGATYSVPVPEGVDPNAFSHQVATSIGQQPAPLSPLNTPTPMPTPTTTIGQPSRVSLASSLDHDDHVVDVEAMPDHILGGKNGTSSGITYHTVPVQSKTGAWSVETTKESYGQGKWPILNPLRFLVGNTVLNPHIQNRIDHAYDQATTPQVPAPSVPPSSVTDL